MPVNKLALIRYKTIDKCLQNRFKQWTLDDLIEKVSDALYEYEGIDSGISKRTIQLDIQNMRSDKLGYNAPIIVVNRKYYTYEDKDFTITKSNLSVHDVEVLEDTLKLLGQFQGFNYFEDLGAIVGKLESKLNLQKSSETRYIDFEKNELLVGLNWVEPLLKAVKNKTVLNIKYQSFKARNPSDKIYNPYLLKEYRNRWFLLCTQGRKSQILILALDRIKDVIECNDEKFFMPPSFEPHDFFNDVIGVTKTLNQKTSKIVLKFERSNAPYVLTKPLHSSQEVLKSETDETIVSIQVVLNYELERLVLGFGDSVEVLSPKFLRKRIATKLYNAANIYS